MQLTKEDFLTDKITGEFEFKANRTGAVNDDGSVFYNHEGVELYSFPTITDFVKKIFDNEPANYSVSYYIGERNDDGKITLEDNELLITHGIDNNEDGSSVFSLPFQHRDIKQKYRLSIKGNKTPFFLDYGFDTDMDLRPLKLLERNICMILHEHQLMQIIRFATAKDKPVMGEDFTCSIRIG